MISKEIEGTGLGLYIIKAVVEMFYGKIWFDSEEGKGTKVTAVFQFSNPDRQPLGDVSETLAVLVTGNPAVQFIFDYKKGNYCYHFDSFEQGNK